MSARGARDASREVCNASEEVCNASEEVCNASEGAHDARGVQAWARACGHGGVHAGAGACVLV
jgi:hypothetical protein